MLKLKINYSHNTYLLTIYNFAYTILDQLLLEGVRNVASTSQQETSNVLFDTIITCHRVIMIRFDFFSSVRPKLSLCSFKLVSVLLKANFVAVFVRYTLWATVSQSARSQ
jgi:uncharacterized protein (UPF0248 family)